MGITEDNSFLKKQKEVKKRCNEYWFAISSI